MFKLFKNPAFDNELYKFCNDFCKSNMRNDLPKIEDKLKVQSLLISIIFYTALASYRSDIKLRKKLKMNVPENYSVLLSETIMAFTALNVEYLFNNYKELRNFSEDEILFLSSLIAGLIEKKSEFKNISQVMNARVMLASSTKFTKNDIFGSISEILSACVSSSSLKVNYQTSFSLNSIIEKIGFYAGLPVMANGMFESTDNFMSLLSGNQKAVA